MLQPDFFPVESSILAGNAISERILPLYGLDPLSQCYLLNHGDNDTYLIQQNQTKFILRAWSKDDRPRAEIEAEMALLDFLFQQNVPIARPLTRLDGAFLSEVQAPEGRRFVGLLTFASGSKPGRDMTPVQSRQYGQAIASMHLAFDQITTPYPRPQWNLTKLLTTPLATILPWLEGEPAMHQYLAA